MITRKTIFFQGFKMSCVTELSDIEADSRKEEEKIAEAPVFENPTPKSRSRKKANSKKELKGRKSFL